MNTVIYEQHPVSPSEFIQYWNTTYPARELKRDSELYAPSIGKLSPDAIRNLFVWKFGSRFAVQDRERVERYVILRLAELEALRESSTATDFLERFQNGGPIFRIFLLHCWRPNRFPIYDQHVHRAMSHIENATCEELQTMSEKQVVLAYPERYLPFHAKFSGIERRAVDRALWSYGKFVKHSRLPGCCESTFQRAHSARPEQT